MVTMTTRTKMTRRKKKKRGEKRLKLLQGVLKLALSCTHSTCGCGWCTRAVLSAHVVPSVLLCSLSISRSV